MSTCQPFSLSSLSPMFFDSFENKEGGNCVRSIVDTCDSRTDRFVTFRCHGRPRHRVCGKC
jgi:hypothetical protein